jgi:transposase-like protein
MSKRMQHSGEFKGPVALEAVKGLKTVSEIACEYEVHPVQVSPWKKDLPESLP